jgi:hypothetical protein
MWVFSEQGLYGWPRLIVSGAIVLLFVLLLLRWPPQPRSST